MAAPDTDYLLALRMQLQESGAGDLDVADLLGLDTYAHTSDETLRSLAVAQSLEASNQLLASDSKLARNTAAKQHGLDPDACSVQLEPTKGLSEESNTVQCQICLDEFMPQLAFASEECKHHFCYPCFVQYLQLVIERGHPYPITCPSCRIVWDNDTCLAALSGSESDYQALERLIINKDYTKKIRYCANLKCGTPFDWNVDGAAEQNVSRIARVVCPLCDTETCAICRCVWHEDETCEENAVKTDLESLSALTRANRWMRCPDCAHLIERRAGDCAFVRCTCGCGFCHDCGVAYMTLEPTAENVHGMPGCNCALFPPGDVDEHIQQPPQQQQAQAPQRARHAERAQQARQHHEGVIGPNGHVNIRKCLAEEEHREMGGPLPQSMLACLRGAKCPYDDCGIRFRNIHALEQHLAFVQRHEVYLCCKRPFYEYASLHNHQRNNH